MIPGPRFSMGKNRNVLADTKTPGEAARASPGPWQHGEPVATAVRRGVVAVRRRASPSRGRLRRRPGSRERRRRAGLARAPRPTAHHPAVATGPQRVRALWPRAGASTPPRAGAPPPANGHDGAAAGSAGGGDGWSGVPRVGWVGHGGRGWSCRVLSRLVVAVHFLCRWCWDSRMVGAWGREYRRWT